MRKDTHVKGNCKTNQCLAPLPPIDFYDKLFEAASVQTVLSPRQPRSAFHFPVFNEELGVAADLAHEPTLTCTYSMLHEKTFMLRCFRKVR